MPFAEQTKLAAKERSHYSCVWCQSADQFIEVHHLDPQEEGGLDVLENAAPLCPNCHTLIGSNSEMRKQLRERRDWWWQHCARLGGSLPREDTTRRLDEVVNTLRSVEAQGGRNELLLTELKSRLVGELQTRVTAVSSASTASQVIEAIQSREPSVYRLAATATYTGTGRRGEMPYPYNSYFIVSSTGVVSGPTGVWQDGAAVTIVPVAGDDSGERHLFAPHGTPDDGMKLALQTLRLLSCNQGLQESFYRLDSSAI